MGVRIGDNGGIRVAPESTYGTAGTVWSVQHPRSASLGPRKALLPSPRLGAMPTTRAYGVGYADGETEVAYDDHRTVIGDLLAAAGNLSTNTYTIGDGSAPDTNSLSVWVDYGGYVLQYVGAKLQSLAFGMEGNNPVTLTTGFLAQSVSEETPVSLTKPDVAGVVWESDLSTITVGGAGACFLSGSIEVAIPIVGADRHCLGAASIKEPEWSGHPTVSGSFNVELEDTSGRDSEAFIASFLAGSAIGDVVVGDFTLTDCYMTGEPPALGEGITQFSFGVEAATLTVTTQA
mgnify:CR=1 FL=1